MKYLKLIYSFIILLFFSSCISQKTNRTNVKSEKPDSLIINPPYLSVPTSGSREESLTTNYVQVRTFYATDRNAIAKGIGTYYGSDRSSMSFGLCNVSIPRIHKTGVVESPSIMSLEINEDPNKHITIISIQPKDKISFFSQISSDIANYNNSAFIFVHGYNVSFGDANRKAAQICYDIDFKGIPIVYSWPSKEEIKSYTIDETNNEWSMNDFKNFLNDFLSKSNVSNIYLVAHSMGGRIICKAVNSLIIENSKYKKSFKGIILAAPDVDADIFIRDFAPALVSSSKRTTLYVSSKDEALNLSKKFHGYQRIGDASNKLRTVSGIEMVDATNAETDFTGHSYYGNSRTVLDDIFYLINNDIGADKRFLIKSPSKDGIYWKMKY